MDRLVLWVKRIVGSTNTDLDPAHAPLFVNLLIAAFKSAVVRAVLWLILPADGAFQEGAHTTRSGIPVVVDQFIASLLKLAKPASRQECFLSFLIVAEHPLKNSVYSASPQRAVSPPSIAEGVDTYAVTMTWADEIVWMNKYPEQIWSFSWGELSLLRSDTPYLTYHFITMEIEDTIDDERVRKVLLLLEQVPLLQRDQTFKVDSAAKRERPHFRDLVEYFKFREVWKVFYVDHMHCTPFFEAVHNLIWSRITSSNDPMLRNIFLPTTVTAIPGTASFAYVFNFEMVAKNIKIKTLQ
jgi:hypothetical protein